MALIKKFEDIIAWQEATKLVATVYRLTNSGALAKDFGLRDQLQRAAVSAMTNIAEGFDCESKIEFARFLSIVRQWKFNPFYMLHWTLGTSTNKLSRLNTNRQRRPRR